MPHFCLINQSEQFGYCGVSRLSMLGAVQMVTKVSSFVSLSASNLSYVNRWGLHIMCHIDAILKGVTESIRLGCLGRPHTLEGGPNILAREWVFSSRSISISDNLARIPVEPATNSSSEGCTKVLKL
ncbi:Uncharacterized protein Fot_33370 [Forsythia ovata]|uniref:Uncharacterized protein n=1 Tax=Forsythia ovata TaxID=205694 RepID=A0ABD1TB12_9LAMI